MLEAIVRDALGDPAAGRAVERALDLAEPDGALSAFLLYPPPGLLKRHAQHSTRHAALISEILDLLPGEHEKPEGYEETASSRAQTVPAGPALPLIEPLSQSEIRVLRYTPTNLSAPEIARELSLSVHTVRTHVRHLFAKLGAPPYRSGRASPRPRPARTLTVPPRTLRFSGTRQQAPAPTAFADSGRL